MPREPPVMSATRPASERLTMAGDYTDGQSPDLVADSWPRALCCDGKVGIQVLSFAVRTDKDVSASPIQQGIRQESRVAAVSRVAAEVLPR